MSKRAGSGTKPRPRSSHPPPREDPDFWPRLVVAVIGSLLVPWVYAVYQHADFTEGYFEGLNRSRALWLVPGFYLGMGIGTALFFPAYLHFFWAFHLLVLARLGELLVHQSGYAPGVSLPLESHFTLLRGGAFVLALGGLAGAGLWLRRWGRRREIQKIVGEDQYLLPFRSVTETSADLATTRHVALQKDRSTLVLGETGAGKTETIKLLTYQMQASDDEPFVVFDYKGEYQDFLTDQCGRDEEDLIYLSSRSASHTWNLFAEIEDEADVDEIARAMFPQPEGPEFFSAAARQLFVAVVSYLYRTADEDTTPTNFDLVEFVSTTDKREMYERLSMYPDLTAAAAAIDPDAERQSAGVYANFQQVIADLFRGDFAEAGDFSIREYMNDPQGRTLVLDFPIQEGDAVQPAFRFFVDWSARFALSDERGVFFVLDEFARLPHLRKLGDLINAGRGRNTQLVLGVQSVAQLNDTYGSDRAEALLSGLVQSVVMRVGERASVNFARGQLGREPQGGTGRSGRSGGWENRQWESYPIAESDLERLDDGEAITVRPDGWLRGQLAQLEAVRVDLDRALEEEGWQSRLPDDLSTLSTVD